MTPYDAMLNHEVEAGQEPNPLMILPIGTPEHLEYLDELRDSGETNMFGAGVYLRREFGLDKTEASAVLSYWMKTFGERHKENNA